MSVTSSGRSSIRSIQTSISLLYLIISFARVVSRTVLPPFGGATIRPLCPLPIGEIKSISLEETSPSPRLIRSLGYDGINSSNIGLFKALSIVSLFMNSILIRP